MNIFQFAAMTAALVLLPSLAEAADPVVSNISAVQRAGTQLVDITYDVTADTPTVSVTLAISSDNGTTFSVPATTVSGAIGAGVATGTGKAITWNAGADWSKQYTTTMGFKVTADDLIVPNFSLIPAGSFQMGDALDGLSDAPIRTVTVSAFYMGQKEVTWADWGTVRTWGLTHGYTDLAVGAGKAATHPVQSITWYNMVKWCNARSEMDGLTPCYTVSGVVYRTGSSAPDCNWAATGYRLPSEAEWEKAARGGLIGKRFPWGDRISQSQANYYGNPSSFTYDDGPAGYNSIGSIGGTSPATSPVGSFPANGYGLYDMAGNVWEWCWDWYGTYAAGAQTDPRGVASGSNRVYRGGGWYNLALYCRVADRISDYPAISYSFLGFRVARSSVIPNPVVSSSATVDTRDYWTLTLSALSHGAITGIAGSGSYLSGTAATLTAVPAAGYVFTGWTGAATGSDNPLSLLMDGGKTLGATFGPDLRDSDGDGLSNYDEVVIYGTDPNKADTDGDGVPDGLEVKEHTNPLDPTKFNSFSKGLVAYYALDGNANDLTGSGANGVARNLGWQASPVGTSGNIGAFLNPNANLGGVLIQDHPSLHLPATGYTICGWVQSPDFSALPNTNYYFLLIESQTVASQQETAFALGYGSQGLNFQCGSMDNYPNPDPGGRNIRFGLTGALSTNVISSKQWHLIALVYDGSVFRGYLDGRELVPQGNNQLYLTAPKVSGRPTALGMRSDLILNSQKNNGSIDEVRLYGRSLSGDEIKGLYGVELPRFQIISGSYTWQQAKADAEARGGRLAVLNTQTKIEALNTYLTGAGAQSNYFIGLTDAEVEGNWKWITGEPLSVSNWNTATNEPNNGNGNGAENGAQVRASWSWAWNDCPLTTFTSPYILEFPDYQTASTLSGLALSEGTLSPTFSTGTLAYSANVPNATSTITVTPTASSATATVQVNGTTVVSGLASASIPVVLGANPITVLVTAQDGTTTSTYTVTVTRFATDSSLSGLALSAGTLSPAFSADTLAYTASVANATSSITVTPTVTDATATVKVNGTTVASGTASGAITLGVGNNTITVLVTAQDGTTTSTYTVTVNRISTVSSLSSLVLSSGTLSPAFAAATKTYTASVANATASITVTPTLTNSFAAVTVNGTPVTSGTASTSIPLTVGTNPITVLVTAQDGTTTSTYTITVTRFATDSSLSGLALSTGTLSPVFATGTMAYAANVPNATAGLTVTPTVTHPAATVKVNGVSVASGVASTSIPLVVGPNVITVQVTAQDSSFTTSYTITVTRPALVAPSFTSATTVPCSLAHITTPANVVNLSLGYAPSAGNHLMVVRNTGLAFITGSFSNLVQGQVVTLPYNNDSYRFVVNYYGGTGNDLVLQWADNKAYTWGSNGLGQLGNTDSPSSSVPLAVTTSDMLANKTFVSIAVGSSHSVALCSDGTMAAWGNNTYGQLGDGTNNNSNVPVAVLASGAALLNKTVVAIAAGFNHSMALCSDGTVAAWGFNSSGQLGNSNNTSSNVPVAVTKTGALLNKTVVAVAAGYNHSLARCADGSVFTWGSNAYGQLGNTTTSNSNVPMNITAFGELNGRTVVFLVGGSDHSIGLCSDGSLVSWGRNNYGQLGKGDLINSSLPVVVDASDVISGKVITAIATGGWHTLALCSDGTLAAFGRNNNGQLGNGNTTDSSVPVRVVTATGVLFNKTITAIGGSNAHSLALCADGTLAAWGSNNNGQLGNDLTITSSNVPIAVTRSTIGSGEKFTDLATGSSANHVMALAAFHVSSNSTLSGLALSSGSISPTFVAGTTAYAASVSNATASVTVTPSVADANATVKVNGVTVASGTASASIPLVVGDNPISVVVTAQDGISLTTYTVTVTRVSTLSTLSGLALSAGSLSPTFVTGITAYTASVTASVMSVTPTVTDSNATVTVNGVSVASGAASAPIQLVVGTNPINVQVTAQDGTTQSTYTVTVTRISTVSTLAGMGLSTGVLSPIFTASTTAYTANIPSTTSSITVTPTVTDTTASVKVNGTAVASGSASGAISLVSSAVNTITVVVTAQDGITFIIYSVIINNTPFGIWQKNTFAGSADFKDPAISGDLATPAHDGITNLVKYALALEPMTCGTGNLPTMTQQDGYLALTYRKSKTATDVTYTVQAADTLDGNAWAPATTVLSQTDPTPGGGSYWLVTVRDTVPYAGQAHRFMRLQVGK